jgi:hypothetical protein
VKIPKVFVGTMYCGEGDFDYCCEAIKIQKNVNVTHHVIKNKPEKEAHNELWASWRLAKQEQPYDLFVKVDADTIINDNVLFEFSNIIRLNNRITGIQAPLLDFFTLKFINGLNCFAPNVVFNDTANHLYCDRNVDVGHDLILSSELVPDTLKPAGFHCFFATNHQSFHFGIHRALKNQREVLNNVYAANQTKFDIRRKLVLMGAEISPLFKNGGFNYDDELFKEQFNIAMKEINLK